MSTTLRLALRDFHSPGKDLITAAWDELGAWVLDSSSPFKNRSKEDLFAAAWDELDGVQAAAVLQ
jgi:hypothetical protein